MKAHQLNFQVSVETNYSEFSFSFRAYVEDHIRIGLDSISIPELHEKYMQLAPIKPIRYKYVEIEIIIGQDFYHATRPVEHFLGEDSFSMCAVRLLIGCVLTQSRLASNVLSKTCPLRTKLKLGTCCSHMAPSSR